MIFQQISNEMNKFTVCIIARVNRLFQNFIYFNKHISDVWLQTELFVFVRKIEEEESGKRSHKNPRIIMPTICSQCLKVRMHRK